MNSSKIISRILRKPFLIIMESLLEKDPKSSQNEYRTLMIGLDSAGKTVLLYKLKLHEFIPTIPTIGFNVETISFNNLDLTIWDLNSGTDKLRSLWKYYLPNLDGLMPNILQIYKLFYILQRNKWIISHLKIQ